MKLSFLIVDDHQIVRRGLKQIVLDEFANAKIIEAGSAEEAIKLIRKEEFNLVISDISMPGGRSGIDLVKQLHEAYPSLAVLVLSMHEENQYAIRALKAGASGYLTKASVCFELIKAIKQVLGGRKYISVAVAELLADNIMVKNNNKPTHELLSDRELEVMILMGSGKSVSEISSEISLSINTISTYRTRILEKMMMHSNAEIIRYVIENQLI